MKAVVLNEERSVQLKELEKPTPKENGVLVKVIAAAVNPLDYHKANSRLADWIGKVFFRQTPNPRMGVDLAGRVEAVGSSVQQFKPGDEVFGCCAGAFAEYVSANQIYLAHKPANLSFEEAAAIPVVAFTALQGLRDTGKIHAGQKVLVNGASSGIGIMVVQLARYFGASHVTGVCSTRNVDMVRSIGADHVIDYSREDFTRNGQQYDLIYDAIGNRSVFAYRRALKPGGTCVIAGFTSFPLVIESFVVGALVSKFGNRKVINMGVSKTNQEDLLFMKELLETGKVKPVIDRCYPLSETAEAIRYLSQKHAQGKVIINVASYEESKAIT